MDLPDLLQEMLKKMTYQEQDGDFLKRARAMLKDIKGPDKVCKLNKAFYGLRQAKRQWYAEFDKALRSIGLAPTNADPCVYIGGKLTFVLVYVNDILIVSNDRDKENQIKS